MYRSLLAGKAIQGLRGRWLVQDVNDPDSGFAVSVWETLEDIRADTVGQPPSAFKEYFCLGKFPQLFCLQSRHVGHSNFGSWGLANSIRAYEQSDAYRDLYVPTLRPFFAGEYTTYRCDVKYSQ
jgi:hypothetical protein